MTDPFGAVFFAIALATLGVGGCLAADRTGPRYLEWLGKPLASLAFLGLGFYAARRHGTPTTNAFLAALALSLVGDLALMGKGNLAFLAGLGAFLLGHVAFVVAFVLRGFSLSYVLTMVPFLALAAVVVVRWLMPHVPLPMRGPVVAYMLVISAMVIFAVGTHGQKSSAAMVVAAAMFFVSDLAVARQKFISPDAGNRLWGLPLYYGAQLIFAAHILD